MSNQHEQLFTEITPEQAAIVEGGARLNLISIECIKAGADPAGEDDLNLKVNGRTEFTRGMGTREFAQINKNVLFDRTAKVQLFDSDSGPFNDDEFMGSFDVSSARRGQTTRRLSGSGSTYDLTFSVS